MDYLLYLLILIMIKTIIFLPIHQILMMNYQFLRHDLFPIYKL